MVLFLMKCKLLWFIIGQIFVVNTAIIYNRGLGKSLQALLCLVLTRIEYLILDTLPNAKEIETAGQFFFPPSLIVCPASLTLHWANEISTHFINNQFLLAKVFEGGDLWKFEDCSIVIVSYELLRRYQLKFHSVIWDMIILDEDHLIRTPNANVSKAIFALSGRHRLALTGTPIQNKVIAYC